MARFPSMTINPAGEAKEKSWWIYTLLGVVLLFAGAFVLANLVFASAVSAPWGGSTSKASRLTPEETCSLGASCSRGST